MRRDDRIRAVAAVFGTLCAVAATPASTPPAPCDAACAEQGFRDATRAVRPPREVVHDLTAVDPANARLVWKEFADPRVLVATWTPYPDPYERAVERGALLSIAWEAWVTAVPDLKTFCAAVPAGSREHRVAEHLGMRWPEEGRRMLVVEYWVRPDDLFRPCPDAEVSDTACQLDFPSDVQPDHVRWVQEHRKDTRYPWTQLGYAYDWGDAAHHVGLSEFVVREGAKVLVEGKPRTLEEYCTTRAPQPSRPAGP